jgi:hypothetical protein
MKRVKKGDRVTEVRGRHKRSGVLREVYELRDKRGRSEGILRAIVLFDGDKIPTMGVRVDELRPGGNADKERSP